MEHKQLIVFPRGQLDDAEKRRLLEHGVLAIEADDPSKIVAVIPAAPLLTGDSVLAAALHAICDGGYDSTTCRKFVYRMRLAANLAANP